MSGYLFTVIFSVILIFGMHWTFQYMRDTYTIKKHVIPGQFQSEKYEQILRELAERPQQTYALTPYVAPNANTEFTDQDATNLHMDLDEFVKTIDISL